MELVRLNKYLKDQNICSRRKADEFIAKGYIKVNGNIIMELGYKVNPHQDKIEVLPELHKETASFRYILLNKPIGYVCSKAKDEGKTIFDLVPPIKNLTYAGRLDKDSHGLVILSDDGKFIYSIAGNEFKREKEYVVKVDRPVTTEFIIRQSNGSIMLDGRLLRRAKVVQIDEFKYKIILTEGLNRQIRRMAEHMGYKVLDLQRVRVGNICDSKLALGSWRELTQLEVKSL